MKKWETETSNPNQRSKPKIQETGLSQGNTKNKDRQHTKLKKYIKNDHHGPIKNRVRPGVPAEWASTASLETPATMAMVKSGAEGRTKLFMETSLYAFATQMFRNGPPIRDGVRKTSGAKRREYTKTDKKKLQWFMLLRKITFFLCNPDFYQI